MKQRIIAGIISVINSIFIAYLTLMEMKANGLVFIGIGLVNVIYLTIVLGRYLLNKDSNEIEELKVKKNMLMLELFCLIVCNLVIPLLSYYIGGNVWGIIYGILCIVGTFVIIKIKTYRIPERDKDIISKGSSVVFIFAAVYFASRVL